MLSLRSDSAKVKKLILIFSVIFNVGMIGYYKYLDFAIETLNAIASTDFVLKNTLLPLGISFFTFQQLSFRIYFDFCGYSEMAIGLGRMFNYELPVNFETPYRAASIGEFWKRRHITLGRSLLSFVYIPLGGNRKGKARKCLKPFPHLPCQRNLARKNSQTQKS